ncbi:MAG TPA: hypothetical protein VNU48_06680, partial [Burkholderiaceae bacterium]|nr:hypothetical protein [Burkholderiaceae bacterium]
ASLLRDKEASKSDYIRSRTVARLLFEKLPALEAIVYQGVALEGSFNMALKPDVADRVLYNGATFVLRVIKRYDHGFYDFEAVNRAKGYFGDGTIKWGAPTTPV